MFHKLTNERWLNLFNVEREGAGTWCFASRCETPYPSLLEKPKPDGVVIAAVVNNSGHPLRHVCTMEYRPPIGGFEFGFPAGLIDEGETVEDAAKREFFEETGLTLKVNKVSPVHLISSAGMSDESVQMVFGTAKGAVSTDHQEKYENIQVHLLTENQLLTLIHKDKPMGAVGWGCKAWPILLAFANGGIHDYYGI